MPTPKSSDTILVIPSIRQVDPVILEAFPKDVFVLIVEDREEGVITLSERMGEVHDHQRQESYLGKENIWLIPRTSSACRSYGYYFAWKEGFKNVVTLDDDCFPHDDYWGDLYFNWPVWKIENLKEITTNHTWVNTLSLLGMKEYPRGHPYGHRLPVDELTSKPYEGGLEKIVAQVGLWDGYLDLDAVDKFVTGGMTWDRSADIETMVVGQDNMFAWCGMNYAFDVRLAPALIHWHNHDDPRIDRYDDIWAGYIVKRAMQYFDDVAVVGRPMVRHKKQGNAILELHKERYNQVLSIYLEQILDEAMHFYGRPSTYADFAYLIAEEIPDVLVRLSVPEKWRDYFNKMAHVIMRWAELFNAGD